MKRLARASALAVCVLGAWAACKSGPEPVSSEKSRAPAAASAVDNAALMDPARGAQQAPEVFKARFDTTKGEFVVEARRDWAPKGADRFYNLVRAGFYDDAAFFRDIAGFMVQFGINGRPEINKVWKDANIADDPAAGHSNQRGMISFATAGPNTRTTQLFINFGDNRRLDGMGFTPFAQVASGMEVVDALNNSYGEGAPRGRGPDQDRIQNEGNAYLRRDFPQLDYVKTARIVP